MGTVRVRVRGSSFESRINSSGHFSLSSAVMAILLAMINLDKGKFEESTIQIRATCYSYMLRNLEPHIILIWRG